MIWKGESPCTHTEWKKNGASSTGGTSGIGLAAAKMLVRDGAHVFIVGRDAEKGKAALTALSDGKGKATYVEADVST